MAKDTGLASKKGWDLFLWGGISTACGELSTIPIDVVKVRMQVEHLTTKGNDMTRPSMINTLINTVRNEGVMALYLGTSPAIWRQLLYGGLRIGLYEPIKKLLNGNKKEEEKISFINKLLAGIISGAIGAGLCTPTDVIKIRMQARNYFKTRYNSIFHALTTIWHEEGLRGLYKGVIPTSSRAAVIAASELAVYDESKHVIQSSRLLDDGFPTHLAASLVSGLIATFFAAPIDFIKTRMQGQPIDPKTGRGLVYKNSINCVVQTIRKEGFFSLWTGLVPHYLRRGPHLIVSFVVLEKLIEFGNNLKL